MVLWEVNAQKKKEGGRVTMSNIIRYPEYESLSKEVQELQEILTILLTQRDELEYQTCKNLEADYMVKIGALEYKAYEFLWKVLRLKRKIELVQKRINTQKKISIDKIEEQLDVEYQEYAEKLQQQMESINHALHRKKGELLSVEDTIELKTIYRNVVKKLHPDICPNGTSQEEMLYQNAVEAYKNGDIETMRAIGILLEEVSEKKECTDGVSVLLNRKIRLEKQCVTVQESIDLIKQSFPYNQKVILMDNKRVEARKKELEAVIEDYKKVYGEMETRLGELLED